MTTTRNWIKQWKFVLPAVAASAIVLGFGSLQYRNWKLQQDAERFFSYAVNLKIGIATADDVLNLVKSSHQQTNGGFVRCLSGAGDCTGSVLFENYSYNLWLYRLHLATPMAFICRFDIANHVLQQRFMEMVFAEAGNTAAFIREAKTTQLRPSDTLRSPEEKYFKISGGYPSGYLGVLITPDAPLDLRDLAYKFNFKCLSSVRGCKTPEEMLPVLKRKDLYWGQDPWKHGADSP